MAEKEKSALNWPLMPGLNELSFSLKKDPFRSLLNAPSKLIDDTARMITSWFQNYLLIETSYQGKLLKDFWTQAQKCVPLLRSMSVTVIFKTNFFTNEVNTVTLWLPLPRDLLNFKK